MVDRWNPSLQAACAASKDEICVAVGELEYDDPFFAILQYDARIAQPWGRTDVKRELQSLAPLKGLLGPDARYAALSNEGDVYLVGNQTLREKLPGAGLQSADASGAGQMFAIARVGDELWAVGASAQVFVHASTGSWTKLMAGVPDEPGFRPIDFDSIDGSGDDDIYIAGSLVPATVQLDEATEQKLRESNASWDDWDRALEHAKRSAPTRRESIVGRLFHWNGASLRAVPLPIAPDTSLRIGMVEKRNRVWLLGSNGTILVGNREAGFSRIPNVSGREIFTSMASFQDHFLVSSRDAVYRFNGRSLVNIDMPFTPLPLRPLRLEAADDVVFYFDYNGFIFRYDGKEWERIGIPQELLARDFRGLRR